MMTRQQKYPETKTFHFYNANYKNRIAGDCVIRAISTAMNKPWEVVFREMADLGLKKGYMPNDDQIIALYLENNGWIKHKQPRKDDNTKYTGKEFCELIKNKNINLYILYSALLFSTTSLFCWCFQPLLKMSSAPVFMFSFVYVINHGLRAGFSFYVNKLKKFFGFNRLLVVTTFLCLYSFACMILSFYFKMPNISTLSLIFVCIGIGFQLAFAIANISHIHNHALEETRATISSVNNMLQQTISGLSLIRLGHSVL